MARKAFLARLIVLVGVICGALSALAEQRTEKDYYVRVSISQCRLFLYEKQGIRFVLVKEFKVATAKRGLDVIPLGKGKVTRIDLNPVWGPTAYTRRYFKDTKGIDLPTRVAPGSPLNYLGAVRISLSHRTRKGDIYRIHGNNNSKLIGKRVTGGCIRMYNEEGRELAKLIKVGTEIDIVLQ
jgi:lipoprotein-anchoring transpeptidase ErfK/SrfK